MFIKHTQFSSLRVSGILEAGTSAIRAIPPAFPLDATVAVNPFLGQVGEGLAEASTRLARTSGISLTRPRSSYGAEIACGRILDEDLTAALEASNAGNKPADVAQLKAFAQMDGPAPTAVPTIAELAASVSGIDWPSVIEKTVGLWAAGYFDRGQALWSPAPGEGAYAAWRSWASRDLTPEIAGLTGFCSHVTTSPDTSEQAILRVTDRLGISVPAAETLFHRLLMDLGGWAQHARWLLWPLENQSPSIETLGFAGFFGLPAAHRDHGSDVEENHLPVLLKPSMTSTCHGSSNEEKTARIGARAIRALDRFRQAAVSSFAYVEAAGPLYVTKLVKDSLGRPTRKVSTSAAPRLDPALDAETKSATAAAVLKAMSLTNDHAQVVLLVGHGANVKNNPHESAYHCGACGGHSGEVSARLLASLLNDAETRAGLAAHGIDLPDDTRFVAALHDTTTDEITLFDKDQSGPVDEFDLLKKWLKRAGVEARAERALRLPVTNAASIAARAFNWAEIRPEWGLADCAAFIAAPRHLTSKANLEGRAFLHSYDWQTDKDFKTLELILTAPVVVASWISLQYYGSSVAPDVFGGGNKLIHNVVGGIGVVEGNGGRLRPGLPAQALHDGEKGPRKPCL